MTIKDTYTALQSVATAVLPSFTFYGMYKDQYNTVKSVQDYVIVIEPPRQWPINYRNTCEAYFDAKVWVGIRQPIRPATGGAFEYPPFNEIDIRDELMTVSNTFVNGVNSYSTLRVIGDFNGVEDFATLYDAPEGQSTNWQAWCQFTIKIVSYGSTGTISLPVFMPGQRCTTQLTINNGDTLPSGVNPDILFIDSGSIMADIETIPLEITVPNGYIFESCQLFIQYTISEFAITNEDGYIVFVDSISSNRLLLPTSLLIPVSETTYNITGIADNSLGFRVVLKFNKSQE